MDDGEIISPKKHNYACYVEDDHRGEEHVAKSQHVARTVWITEDDVGYDAHEGADDDAGAYDRRNPKSNPQNLVHRNIACTEDEEHAIDVKRLAGIDGADAYDPGKNNPNHSSFAISAA